MAAGLTGSLDEVEEVVVTVEESRSLEAAASVLRPDIELAGAMRWTRRRTVGVRVGLLAILTLMPLWLGTEGSVREIEGILRTERALVEMREIGDLYLRRLPRPLGFGPAARRGNGQQGRQQHKKGPDPP